MSRVAINSQFTETALMAVAHDLKVPLATIRSLTLDSQFADNEEYKIISQSATSALEMLGDMLEVYKASQSQLQLQLSPISANSELEVVVGQFRQFSRLNSKRLQAKYLPKKQHPLALADQALLRRALHNLIDNSLKYSNPRTKVMANVFSEDTSIKYQVADSGPGISQADINALGGQLMTSPTKRSAGASGLGLYLTGSMVRLMNGSVHVESGRAGNFVTLSFPQVLQQRLF